MWILMWIGERVEENSPDKKFIGHLLSPGPLLVLVSGFTQLPELFSLLYLFWITVFKIISRGTEGFLLPIG